MKLNNLIGIAVGATLAAGAACADGLTLRLAHHLPDAHSANANFAIDLIEETAAKSGNTIAIKNFTGGQLGQQLELLEGLGMGTVDLTLVDTGMLANYDPAIGILDLAYEFTDIDQARKALAAGLEQAISDRVSAAAPVEVLAIFPVAFRDTLLREGEVTAPSDLDGLKLRTSQSPVIVQTFQAFGANPTPIPSGEAYSALQTGTVDGMESNKEFIYSIRAHEVASTLAETKHSLNFLALVIGKPSLGKLDDAQIEALRAAAAAATANFNTEADRIEAEYKQKLQDEGVKVMELDLTPFRDITAESRAVFVEDNSAQELQSIIDAAGN